MKRYGCAVWLFLGCSALLGIGLVDSVHHSKNNKIRNIHLTANTVKESKTFKALEIK